MDTQIKHSSHLLECGHAPTKTEYEFTAGYGTDLDGNRYCYDCCAKLDLEYMNTHDKMTLYLSNSSGSWKVSNWPSSLSYRVYPKIGRHNWGLHRYDVWFTDENGNNWWGVRYGDDTEILHCTKVK